MKKWIFGATGFVALAVAVFGWPPFTGGPSGKGLLADSYMSTETGVHRHPNGIYEVAALTRMPGVKAEMVRWWFADYMQTTEHYKRWHPTAHVWMDWENKVPGAYVGASHLVHEYIGTDLVKLRIQFVPPEEILTDAQLKADDVAVCARVGLLETPINVTRMCHIIRNTEFGAEMRSRFWMGHISGRDGNDSVASIEGVLGNTYLVRALALGESDARAVMIHAIEEMGILADFLPGLYAQETGLSPVPVPSDDQQDGA